MINERIKQGKVYNRPDLLDLYAEVDEKDMGVSDFDRGRWLYSNDLGEWIDQGGYYDYQKYAH